MPSLSAHGNDPAQFWCRIMPAEAITLGRSATLSTWSVPWDRMISKRHAPSGLAGRPALDPARPRVLRTPSTSTASPGTSFSVGPGESFTIGDTRFLLAHDAPSTTDQPVPYTELTRSPQELSPLPYSDPSERLELLAALPGIIRDSPRNRPRAQGDRCPAPRNPTR